jgi:hypothetical protein
MIFIERLADVFRRLMPGKRASVAADAPGEQDADLRVNPWTRDLERLACYSAREEAEPTVEKGRSDSCENKIQLLMEQARLEKAKETLKKQQESLGLTSPTPNLDKNGKPRKRTTDATLVDAKAWWGQAVATWDPEDSKNLGPQGEQRHPRTHKWFNQ